jgi:hypothetical protein
MNTVGGNQGVSLLLKEFKGRNVAESVGRTPWKDGDINILKLLSQISPQHLRTNFQIFYVNTDPCFSTKSLLALSSVRRDAKG